MINNVSMQFLSDIDNSLMCFIMHVYRHRPFRDRRGPCSPFLIVKISLAWQLSVSYMSFFLDQSVPIKWVIHSELAGYWYFWCFYFVKITTFWSHDSECFKIATGKWYTSCTFFGKMVTTPFHALGVQPNQILVLRFPPRPNFAFLVGWGAPRLISWSFQRIPVTGVAPQWYRGAPRWNIGPRPGQWGRVF